MAAEESGSLFFLRKSNVSPIYTMYFHRPDFIYDLKAQSPVGRINFALLQRSYKTETVR